MHKLALFFFLAAASCANSFVAAAITTPYANDFSSLDPVSVAEFSRTLGDQWTLLGGKFQNQILANAAPDKSSSAMLQYNGLGGLPATAQDFFLSTSFTITNSVEDFNSVGFAILGNSADATAAMSRFYVADVFVGGTSMNAKLRFAELGPAGPNMLGMTTLDLGKVLVKNTVVYSLQVQGIYDDSGNLTLKLELSGDNDLDTYQIAPIPAAHVLTGDYFGFRNRASGGDGSALTVEYDSINIAAVPEPSTLGFIATSLLAGYAVGRYMHRKMNPPTA